MGSGVSRACPFAPGLAKPDSIPGPRRPRAQLRRRLVNRRSVALVLSLAGLVLLYGYSYPWLEHPRGALLFEDDYLVKLSVYSYVASMLGFFIRRYRRRV